MTTLAFAALARPLAAPPDKGSGSGGAGSSHPFSLATAMRTRMAAAAKAGPIALLDVGTSKVACALVETDPRRSGEAEPLARLRLLGVGHNRSLGIETGAVADLRDAEKAVRAAVNQAEREAGQRAFHVIAALAGGYPRSQPVDAEIDVAGPRVAEKDMAKAIAACRPPPLEEGRRVLDAAPVRWTVDGEANIRAPLGLAGRRLGVDLHVLSVAEAAIRNLAHALARADLEVAGFVSAPFASGLGCLTPEEREDGAAVVDLGGGATTVAMFLRGAFVFADMIRIGGDQLTIDLVRAFDLPKAEAERLKVLEGSAVDLSAGAPPVDLTSIAPGSRARKLSRSELAAAIRPRTLEILSLARDRLAQAGFSYLPRRRVVLTGGGAELGGVLEAAEEVFGAAVRIGRPIAPPGAPASIAGPAFSALAGLARVAAEPPVPLPEVKGAAARGGVSGLFKWLRDSW